MAQQSSRYADTPDGWESTPKEAQVKLSKVGDVFIGQLISKSATATNIPQAHFTNDDGQFFLNCGVEVTRQLKVVPMGSIVRLEKIGEQDVGQDRTMDLVDVKFKRPRQ